VGCEGPAPNASSKENGFDSAVEGAGAAELGAVSTSDEDRKTASKLSSLGADVEPVGASGNVLEVAVKLSFRGGAT
jgi:hypothetical protein